MQKKVIIAAVALALVTTGTALAAHNTQPDNQTATLSAVHVADTPPTEPEAPVTTPTPVAAEPSSPTPAPAPKVEAEPTPPAPTPQPAPAPAPAPRRLVQAVVAYTPSADYPGQEEAYCTYHFDDGSTEVLWAGRRPAPGTQPATVNIGCAPWREQHEQ